MMYAGLTRRSFVTLGVATAMGMAGCTDVEIHAPNGWRPGDPDFPRVGNRDFSAQAAFDMEVDGAGLTALSLTGVAGTVAITSGGGTDVSIEGVRRVRSDSQVDAERSLESLEVDLQQAHGTLYVTTRQPRLAHGRAYEVDYRIVVPDGLDLFVEIVAGEIEVSCSIAEGGVVDLANVAGSVDLELPRSTSASVHAHVVTGSIHVDNLALVDRDPAAGVFRGTLGGGDGSIALSTVAGDVRITGR